MPSVASSFTTNPQPSRIYSTIDEQLKQNIQLFNNLSKLYYSMEDSTHGNNNEIILAKLTIERLVSILKRRINFNGEQPTLTGRKKALVHRIETIFFRFLLL